MTSNSPDQVEEAAVQADQPAMANSGPAAPTEAAAAQPETQASAASPTDAAGSETESIAKAESAGTSDSIESAEAISTDKPESVASTPGTEAAEGAESASPDTSKPTANAAAAATESAGQNPTTAGADRKPADPAPVVADRDTLLKLQAEAEQLSHKHSARLNNLRNRLHKLRKTIGAEQTELRQLADTLDTRVNELVTRNLEHQQALHDKTVALVATLQQALADGKSEQALPTWDKIQGNISNTSGKLRDALQELTGPFKGQLDELRDWKIFAATEKKRELIGRMQQLVDAKIAPQDLNRQIGKMHKDWKALGRSNDNDKLWAEFKKVSDQAYEPCKEFFKQRKQLMADNLQQRRALCDKLEAQLAEIDRDAVDVAAINKLLASSDKTWKKYAPVEQAKIKPLQKRYYGLLNELRKLRKSHARDNAAQKQTLIAEAVKLTQLDDNRQAMQEAKRLQRQWKDIGPSSFKEDKNYWAEFRKACDQIFAQRDQESAARKQEQQQAETELRALLDKLDQVLALDDAALREAKSDFHELARQFNATLNAQGRGARNKLVDRFNDVKRRIDGRFRALPDKKTQALRDNLEALLAQLEPVEQTLLNGASAAGQSAALDDATWQALDNIGEPQLVARLEARRSALAAPDSLAEQAREAETELRTLCIDAEIRAGVDSPESDQGTRMQIQLKQLQDGFGQSRPTAKENQRYAQQTGLLMRCIGPLDGETRKQLQSRLEQVLRRLI